MLQEGRTTLVLRGGFWAFMRTTIDFHYKSCRLADEVAKVDAEPLLAPEFATVKRGTTQSRPEPLFGGG